MEMIFHSYVYKTHFHKKGGALGLILKVRVFGTQKWPIIKLLTNIIKMYAIKQCIKVSESHILCLS